MFASHPYIVQPRFQKFGVEEQCCGVPSGNGYRPDWHLPAHRIAIQENHLDECTDMVVDAQ